MPFNWRMKMSKSPLWVNKLSVYNQATTKNWVGVLWRLAEIQEIHWFRWIGDLIGLPNGKDLIYMLTDFLR